MATNAHTERWAHRAGCKVGRAWRGVVRQDRRAIEWFVKHGWPTGLAKAMLWAFKLIVLGILLYVAFWLALVLVFFIVTAWVMRNTEISNENEPEWCDGLLGFGLYHPDGSRIDPHDPDDEY
ncbi:MULTISPECIES: DUF3742 family protein [Gammaproteobacteria]|jgi:fatty acid desaturase|uniref:DUF3742 family protein n=1 Tax=Gammaproteobacteria TaxID=1236 RepID=UPI00062DEDB7|nr:MULTISPECIES: DUF3742 family protein [Spongiibacter]AKH70665.1 Protein of unknown function (DUF3742) [Spongiibacter sp. IMCC21906]MAY37846.1 DUF3742 domain-containing protein [Spongiibacter sp.]